MTHRTPLAVALVLVACSTETIDSTGSFSEPLTVVGWPEAALLRGTPLVIAGTGFVLPTLGEQRLRIDADDGRTVEVPVLATSETELRGQIDAGFLAVFPPGSRVTGRAVLTRSRGGEGALSESITFGVDAEVVDNLDPVVTSLIAGAGAGTEDALYPGDDVRVLGEGFLLKGEGQTIVQLVGSYETLVPPETASVDIVLPLNGLARNELHFILTPDLLGVRPGVFRGELRVTNESLESARPGAGLPSLQRTLNPPRIDTVSPGVAARGQRITVTGRGFFRTDPLYEATTLLRLEGEFTSLKTSQVLTLAGPSALALFADEFEDNTAIRYVLRVTQTPSGDLEGLGLFAGDFQGRITPMIISGAETIVGQGIDLTLRVALQRQIVFVKFLPGFTATMLEMGLGPREADIRARILAVCARDYEGINIEFREARPLDFAEYSIIEVGGEDPNGQGLFGLDNTSGKDVGNIRFNDVIGGANADSAEQGYFAFGGVFVRSFFALSPTLRTNGEAVAIASARFDDIFSPFMEALGGTPLEEAPTAARTQLADEAVRVLGNVVGNTVVHEVGHSLGLSNIEGEYHNLGDNPGWIMDSGGFRPFAERAEIDGDGPAFFAPFDREYLDRVLPTN